MEAVGRILSIRSDRGEATIDTDGTAHTVSLVLLLAEGTTVAPGDWVRVHTGLVLQRIDEVEAEAEIAARRNLEMEWET